MPDKDAFIDVLKTWIDPYLGTDYVSSKVLQDVTTDQYSVKLKLVLGYPCKSFYDGIQQNIRDLLQPLAPTQRIEISIQQRIVSHNVQPNVKAHKKIKNIIAIASGKGGVGKSTVANHLALALSAEGARVGILDADIYGPSQPLMLGHAGHKAAANDARLLQPVEAYGIQSMSIGYLVDQKTPMIWRGPMVSKALQQLLDETDWGDLDYLVVDLPPGTGDIQLTMAQKIPVTGAVVVTTPQDVALIDARKAYGMFDKVNINVLGVIENMAYYDCPSCGHHEAIFGEQGGVRMAQEYGIPLLGQLPLSLKLRQGMDSGCPITVSDPINELSLMYLEMARKVGGLLALRPRDYSAAFPNIVVE